jgi:hypothetical protein
MGGVVNIKAVAIGTAVDIAGSFLLSAVAGLISGIQLARAGLSPAEIQTRLSNSSTVGTIALIGGLLMTLIGGYLAARIAQVDEVRHGTAVGVVGVILGILFMIVFRSWANPLWYDLAGFLLTIPTAAAGGYLRARNRT